MSRGIRHGAVVEAGGEVAPGARSALAVLERVARRDPGRKAALQDLHVADAEGLQHPAHPRRREQAHPVIDHDVGAVADAERPHAGGEDLRARQHVGQGRGLVAHRVDVEPDRTGDVPGQILGPGIAPLRRQVPGPVEDHDVGRAETGMEPFGRDKGRRRHGFLCSMGRRRVRPASRRRVIGSGHQTTSSSRLHPSRAALRSEPAVPGPRCTLEVDPDRSRPLPRNHRHAHPGPRPRRHSRPRPLGCSPGAILGDRFRSEYDQQLRDAASAAAPLAHPRPPGPLPALAPSATRMPPRFRAPAVPSRRARVDRAPRPPALPRAEAPVTIQTRGRAGGPAFFVAADPTVVPTPGRCGYGWRVVPA